MKIGQLGQSEQVLALKKVQVGFILPFLNFKTMTKRLLSGAFLSLFIFLSASIEAQQTREGKKEDNRLKKELSEKATKTVRKEAKQLEKEGWDVLPGALPLEKQLERAYLKQLEEDENGYPRFIVASGMSVAETQIGAKIEAENFAKTSIAGQIETLVKSQVDQIVGNQQLTREEAVTVQQTISASKNAVANRLGRVIVLTELLRDTGKKAIEYQVRIAFNQEEALRIMKDTAKEELRLKAEDLSNKLGEFDW